MNGQHNILVLISLQYFSIDYHYVRLALPVVAYLGYVQLLGWFCHAQDLSICHIRYLNLNNISYL